MPLTDADFQRALNTLLKHEGSGYNAADPSGGSKYGVLQSTYTAWLRKNGLPSKNIKDITLTEVANIYRSEYWQASGAPSLPYDLASLHFDSAVNMGVGTAKRLLAASGGDLQRYIAARQAEYRAIAQRNPSLGKYLNVWLNRAASFAGSTAGKVTGGAAVLLLLVGAALVLRKH